MEVVGPAYVARSSNIEFSITKTLRNEDVDISAQSANFVLDLNGTIYKLSEPSPDSATVVLVGGLDTFINEKNKRMPKFYMTSRQKVVIYNILKIVAHNTDTAKITATDSALDQIVHATYFNYCG